MLGRRIGRSDTLSRLVYLCIVVLCACSEPVSGPSAPPPSTFDIGTQSVGPDISTLSDTTAPDVTQYNDAGSTADVGAGDAFVKDGFAVRNDVVQSDVMMSDDILATVDVAASKDTAVLVDVSEPTDVGMVEDTSLSDTSDFDAGGEADIAVDDIGAKDAGPVKDVGTKPDVNSSDPDSSSGGSDADSGTPDAAGSDQDANSSDPDTSAADTEPPTWVGDAVLSVAALAPTSVQLVWTSAIDNVAVTQYWLHQYGLPLQKVGETGVTVDGLTPETAYTFSVYAGDAAGNWSQSPLELSITTPSEITEWDTATVFELLKPTCVGCHGVTSPSAPYFASLAAFESGIANDPQYVVPGEPANSELVALLEGTGAGSFSQMPLGASTFAELEAAGLTQIGVADVKAWIEAMSQGGGSGGTEPVDGPLNQRLRAEQIFRSLYDLLGLSDDDFMTYGSFYGDVNGDCVSNQLGDSFPIRSPDAHPAQCTNSNVYGKATSRFYALGGPGWRSGVRRDNSISPTFLLHLTQTVQAHCRLAIKKSGNTAVLNSVSLSATSQSNEAAIRANISYLHLKFLGLVATPQQEDALFSLFETYEAGVEPGMNANERAVAGWTAVCASLLRNPLWITH